MPATDRERARPEKMQEFPRFGIPSPPTLLLEKWASKQIPPAVIPCNFNSHRWPSDIFLRTFVLCGNSRFNKNPVLISTSMENTINVIIRNPLKLNHTNQEDLSCRMKSSWSRNRAEIRNDSVFRNNRCLKVLFY